jgi:hypothetical protein
MPPVDRTPDTTGLGIDEGELPWWQPPRTPSGAPAPAGTVRDYSAARASCSMVVPASLRS